MKTRIFWTWGLGLALTALPLTGECAPETDPSAPIPGSTPDTLTALDLAMVTNAPTAEAAQQQLENASGTLMSLAKSPAASSNLSSPAAEIVKLTQAGVDESVMLSYATNSPYTFNLSSDDIVYLNDIGVPSSVVTAMIQHDQSLKGAAPGATMASAPPVYTNQIVPPPGTPIPYPDTAMTDTPVPDMAENMPSPEQDNGSYSYFYDSLAPYGNWIYVSGYGPCWQPTVVVSNPWWRPYCDNGHWVYSDCGWYWSSSYTWGWAPFHYGRWFCHSRWGWCWAPDTVWGASWVTWRYAPGYCGWAPLPPTACYTPSVGFSYCGRSVGWSFNFGLTADRFTFVGARHFTDAHLEPHRLPLQSGRQIFNSTVVFNRFSQGRNNTPINEGLPVNYIATARGSQIPRVRIRDATDPVSARSERVERDGSRSVVAFRPNLPQPSHSTTLVGQGIRPAPQSGSIARTSSSTGIAPMTSRAQFTAANSGAQINRVQAIPTPGNQRGLTTRNDANPNITTRDSQAIPSAARSSPIILRGPDRSTVANNQRDPYPPGSVIVTGPQNANRGPSMNESMQPAEPTQVVPRSVPGQNNSARVIMNPNQRQYSLPAQPNSSAASGQYPRTFRGEDPRAAQPNQSAYTPPTAPAQTRQVPNVYQQPRVPDVPQQYRQPTPAPQPQSPPPSVRSQPQPQPPVQQYQPPQNSAPARSFPGAGVGGGAGRPNH